MLVKLLSFISTPMALYLLSFQITRSLCLILLLSLVTDIRGSLPTDIACVRAGTHLLKRYLLHFLDVGWFLHFAIIRKFSICFENSATPRIDFVFVVFICLCYVYPYVLFFSSNIHAYSLIWPLSWCPGWYDSAECLAVSSMFFMQLAWLRPYILKMVI